MFILILAASLIIGVAAILTTFPSNKVAVAGSKVIMECRTNTSKKLLWKQQLLNVEENNGLLETIFTGNRFTNGCKEKYDIIRESDGQFDLKFNATLSHGNEYTCIEPGGDSYTAQLIVLASETKCYVNGKSVTSNLTVVDEEEYIELKCNVTFAGSWSPKMEWVQRINSENDWMIIASHEETEKRDNICLIATILALNATHNATSYTCKTRFLKTDLPNTTTAKNIPEYSYNWTSPNFALRYFYKISNRKQQEQEQHFWNIELANKGWLLVSLILAVLLFISISAIISVTLHFIVCRKKTQAEHSEEISLHMRSSVNVDSPVSASTGMRSEETPASMPAYEEVDLEPSSSRIVVERTTEGTSADDKYSALVKSDVIPPKPHNYEAINLPEMADDTNVINARPQNESSNVRMESFPDYVNVLNYRFS